MNTDRVDLLPIERARALRRAYLGRLLVVASILATVLALAATALLLPSYRYLAVTEGHEQVRLAGLTATLSSGEEGALARRYAALEADAETLASLGASPRATAVVRAALATVRPGVALTGLDYAPEGGGKAGRISISGTATSRNDLRAYELALHAVPGFASTDLPVGSYAKDRDIPFTIAVVLATSSPL